MIIKKSLPPLLLPPCISHQQSASQPAPGLTSGSKPLWKGARRQVPIQEIPTDDVHLANCKGHIRLCLGEENRPGEKDLIPKAP